MEDSARIMFTASTQGQAVTERLLADVLTDQRLSALNDFSKVAFAEEVMAFPRTPSYVFGIQVDNKAFGTDLVGGANQTALELMHIIRDKGVDITPWAVINQRNGEFRRNTGLNTTFSDPERPFNTYDCPATELTMRR